MGLCLSAVNNLISQFTHNDNDSHSDDDDVDAVGRPSLVNRRRYQPEWVTPKPSLLASYSGQKVCRRPAPSRGVTSSARLTISSLLALRDRQRQGICEDFVWECQTRRHWTVLQSMISRRANSLSRSVSSFTIIIRITLSVRTHLQYTVSDINPCSRFVIAVNRFLADIGIIMLSVRLSVTLYIAAKQYIV